MSLQDLLKSVQGMLDEYGITASVQIPDLLDGDASCRMICITGDLGASRSKMRSTSRDHVVMVRVDDESLEGLDRWIASGVATSRSEAAALFIKEGLALRSQELSELDASIAKVERAKDELRAKARDILGSQSDG